MAYICLEFFGLLLKILKDSFWNALTHVTQPYRFCLCVTSYCGKWTAVWKDRLSITAVFILFYSCYMFWLLWKVIIKQSKNRKKDNLNIIYLKDTSARSWDINFTETAIVYVETSWKLSLYHWKEKYRVLCSDLDNCVGMFVHSVVKPNLFPAKKEWRMTRAYFQDWKNICNVLYDRVL